MKLKAMSQARAFWAVGITLLVLFLCFRGIYAPHLRGYSAFVIRYFIVFPGLLISLIYFTYFKRIGHSTSFRISLAGATQRDRWRIRFLAPLGMVVGAWFVATISLGAAILLAYWVPGTEVSHRYIVESVARRGGGLWSGRLEVGLRRTGADDVWTLSVPRNRFAAFPFDLGEQLIVTSTAGPFGSVPLQVCAKERCILVNE